MNRETEHLLKTAMEEWSLSAHAYDKILKIAYTTADLEECHTITLRYIAEAIQYRSLDRNFWT